MSNRVKVILILVLMVVAAIVLPRFSSGAVTASVAVRPEVLVPLHLGGFTLEISNTLFTTWIVMLLLVWFAYAATRKMQLVPSGLQNLMETIIEMLDGLTSSVAGNRGRKFFPIVATIFLFVLVSNWLGLIPGFGPVGYITVSDKHPAPEGIATFDLGKGFSDFIGPQHESKDDHKTETKPVDSHGEPAKGATTQAAPAEEEEQVLAPFVRSPSTDMNTTLALALISVVLTQIFGMQVVGVLKYWTKFFVFGKFIEFFKELFKGKFNGGLLGFGFLDFFVGILEFVSEMVKILSFTFRLFGNIFAGEVVLLIMAFLGSTYFFLGMPFPFYALEIFVGFMQAFVFAILTLVFMTIATTAHGAEEHH